MGTRPEQLSPVRAHLAALLDLATQRAESDPVPERRTKHRRLARWLVYRIARRILRESGR